MKPTEIELWDEPRVTDNARLLAGFVMGAICGLGDKGYRFVEADATKAESIVERTATGNRFILRVEQIGGTE